MTTLLLTLTIAFIVVVIAIALLGVSWLIKGKSTLRAGSCGRDPTKKSDKTDSCGTDVSCQLCNKPNDEKK
jgi:hypothetical protein